MEKIFVPSLQFLSSLRIALTLWIQRDIDERVSGFNFNICFDSSWRIVADAVETKAHALPVPALLKKEILQCVSVISWQICSFCKYDVQCGLSVKDLYWTNEGCIDKNTSVAKFVKNETFSFSARFRIACWHFSEYKFDELLEENANAFSQELLEGYDWSKSSFRNLVLTYWKNRFLIGMGQPILEPEIDEYTIFCNAVENGHGIGCRYLWPKIRNSVDVNELVNLACCAARNRLGVWSTIRANYSDVFCFLLSQMDDEHEMKVFVRGPVEALNCFLDWPLQRCFTHVVSRMWELFSDYNWMPVFYQIVFEIQMGNDNYDYSLLFQECLKIMPSANRRLFVGKCATNPVDSVMHYLFLEKDVASISSVLFYATDEEKECIFFTEQSTFLCVKLARERKWASLSTYLEACIKPRSERNVNFRGKIKTFFSHNIFKIGLAEERSAVCRMIDIVDSD